MSVQASSPNAANVEFWNDVLVARFERFRDLFVGASDIHSRGPIERAGLQPGMRVLDVGCGFGETSLQIAELVGPTGAVVGMDCCEQFLAAGRADAAAAGLRNATFVLDDAQSAEFAHDFDFVFARFGTMFFQNPTAAMRNIRTALAPGGRLLMVVWRPLEDNPWLSFAKAVTQRYLPPPPDEAPSCGPGPFSMSDPDVVTAILTGAGYSGVSFERTDAVVRVGSSVEEAMAFQLSIGPAAEIFRDAPEQAERHRAAIESDLRAVLEQHLRPDGVWMGTSSWAVSARA
jgi:ubiquinone/menaquinone biosynthesis C-methylase UbiE